MRSTLVVLVLISVGLLSLGLLRLPFDLATLGPPSDNPTSVWSPREPFEVKSTTNPPFVWFQKDGVYSVLTAPLGYNIEMTSRFLEVPAGFVTDYASVPQLLQWAVPKIGAYSVPAIVHDYLYWDQTCTREQADKILYAAMEEYDVNLPTRLLVYLAVRVGAASAWSVSTAEKAAGLPRFVPPPAPISPPR